MNKWTRWEDWVAVGVGLVAAVSALVLPAMGASMAWMLILGVLLIASGIVNLAMPGMAAMRRSLFLSAVISLSMEEREKSSNAVSYWCKPAMVPCEG